VDFDGEAVPDRNLLKGRITFSAYLGNTLRYDVELSPGHTFKIDVRDPWHHELRPMGAEVAVSFPAGSTVAIGDGK
jgi:hypothetical protein